METSGATVTPERFGELAQNIGKATNVLGKTIDVTAWSPFSRDAETVG